MIWNFYDWDDTIVYTRQSIYFAYKKAIKDVKNYDLGWVEFNEKVYSNSNSYMAQEGYSNEDIAKVKQLKKEYYLEELGHIKVLINDFNSSEQHLIVSNTSGSTITEMLPLLGLPSAGNFHSVIGSDIYLGVNRKPAPDLYNYAFSRIEKSFVKSQDTIVIYEDSIFGLNAALSFYQEHKDKINNFKIIYKPINIY